ncbi:rRNA maturation RNase YbeY [Candidatus Nomurabacteria bacterium RIFCSPLOWO2_01_FULL_42_20]|uniref:Endoribonuclease YbeY n=1 Tax=Candidatus Nomurabacteria bacterium RIFCSPHIGHO2_01_FULL_42_16 TaxID=1801743 RepID=A0A1F6VKA1_9BACT|nr:MAG: rRNA maturation RNase YbeY [Candidatus Nomurabacteria bacterium RIFCSPHIGHO2_01_FULL_42_16]OGI92445.1 MAG: rRNA maturation RNase YbeY [Candidatus Nomurabacteria bacterium RIFCSPLOWO2_01_FULL_42_20]
MVKLLKQIKDEILGKNYILSLAFIDAAKMKKINRIYRGQNKAANILSFAFSKNEGEILLNKARIKKETALFGLPYRKLLGRLFIHGCLHLKGIQHSSKMERAEKKWQNTFQLE